MSARLVEPNQETVAQFQMNSWAGVPSRVKTVIDESVLKGFENRWTASISSRKTVKLIVLTWRSGWMTQKENYLELR